jgi:N-carbamoylputrescine amidase
MENIRIACVVFHSPLGSNLSNLNRMTNWVGQAKSQGVRILCFPEMNITGYGVGESIESLGESCAGPAVKMILEMAAQYDMTILAGFAEKDDDGRLFASHVAASPNGLTGIYRKLHLAPPEINRFSAGNTIPIFDLYGIRFGIQLCYDAHFPELSTHMALKGAEVLFIPHASPRGNPEQKYRSWMRHLPARAYDNGVFLIVCNQTGDNGKGLNFPGVAMVIGPDGEVINSYIGDNEYLLVADLSAEDLKKVKDHRMRYFLRNRRNDLFPLGKAPE